MFVKFTQANFLFASSSYNSLPFSEFSTVLYFNPHFEDIILLSSDFYCCYWECCCQTNCHSLQINRPFFLLLFKLFSLSLVFCSFIVIKVSIDLFLFFLLRIHCTSRMWIQVFHQYWKIHSHHFLEFAPLSLSIFSLEMAFIIYNLPVCIVSYYSLMFSILSLISVMILNTLISWILSYCAILWCLGDSNPDFCCIFTYSQWYIFSCNFGLWALLQQDFICENLLQPGFITGINFTWNQF